ncbi:unnamed protein product [Lupinus luteus]|uniref:Uncharacterized protein n=1 Tax=Lupinus luteus TaxID=3873 RepID=A0AAV1XJM3_LUPLU
MEGENNMITPNIPNMSSTREPTSQNHSSLSLQVEPNNNLIIMNMTQQACKAPNTIVNSDKGEESGRERLKRHREEVMGKVKIPKKWGKEKLLKDWVEYTTFDALFPPHTSIITARDALIADGRRASEAAAALLPFLCQSRPSLLAGGSHINGSRSLAVGTCDEDCPRSEPPLISWQHVGKDYVDLKLFDPAKDCLLQWHHLLWLS